MSMQETLREELTAAMKAKEEPKLTVLRGLMAMMTHELTTTKRTPQTPMEDEEVLGLIRRAVKQRTEAAEQFKAGNRADLAETEEAEAAILKAYLPQLMSREEIHPLALAKREEMAITDKSKAGMLTGALMKDLKGKADGGDVKAVVDSLF